MLTDNAVEQVLHQIAKDKDRFNGSFLSAERVYPHKKELAKALGRSFDAKVRFARLEGFLTNEMAQTICILHSYRNELYHIGLQHKLILPDLAEFYFVVACDFLVTFKTHGLSWTSGMQLPAHPKKYFSGDKIFPEKFEYLSKGCKSLTDQSAHENRRFIISLAD